MLFQVIIYMYFLLPSHQYFFANTYLYNYTLSNVLAPLPSNPCNPSPCGPNSQCREINNVAVCSCIPGYSGNPPTCRPECTTSAECPLNKACNNYKCVDPCKGTCGISALCEVVNHNPICSCPKEMTGNPFTRCTPKRKYLVIIIIMYEQFYIVFSIMT